MGKKLKDLITLSGNVKIYIPSTIDVDKPYDNTAEVDNASKFLSELFGGATAYKALGSWISETKGRVKEDITIVSAYASTEVAIEDNIKTIIEYCEALCKELKQEAITLEVNNKLHFID